MILDTSYSQRILQASRKLSGPKPLTCPELVEGSPRTFQSFVKELANPTQEKIVFKKFPELSKK